MIKYPIQVSNEMSIESLRSIRDTLEKKGVPYGIAEVDSEGAENSDQADENGKLFTVCRALTEKDKKDKAYMETIFTRLPNVPKNIVIEFNPDE